MEATAVVVAEGSKVMEMANDEKLVVVVGDDGGDAKKIAATDEVAAAVDESQKKKKKGKKPIHVSNTKHPIFYCNLAKRHIRQYNAVELSALGTAIPTLITIAETLKSIGLAVEKKISTSTVASKPDGEDGRIVMKPQIAILLGKAEKIEETPVPVVAAA